MTPSARVAAAIGILHDIARADSPADAILRDWTRRNRFAGSKDRRAIRELVYRDLRGGARFRSLVAAQGGDPENPRTRMIVACETETPGSAAGLFDSGGYGPAALNEAEVALAAGLPGIDEATVPAWVRANCPEDLFAMFETQWGAETEAELAALNERAPVDIRVNTLRATRKDVQVGLTAVGYETVPTPFSPVGLRGDENVRLTDLPPFRDGLADPQDESSQIVARLCGTRPGMMVIDLCAGAGGKALALAANMQNRGQIIACDVSAARLSRIEPRAARLGVQIVRLLPLPDGVPPADLAVTADAVLVDAPCSGSGTWRRSPEQRWRTTPEKIAEYAKVQRDILEGAAALVKPGGRLVYAVCSLFDAEGRDIATAFADAHSEYRRAPVSGFVEALEEGPDGTMLLTPRRHGTDGMFAAVFERGA
jgi:16S rRNA (cytosine967-C5)-methyltransferase